MLSRLHRQNGVLMTTGTDRQGLTKTLVQDLRSWIGFPKKELDELLEKAADTLEAMASVGVRQEGEVERLRVELARAIQVVADYDTELATLRAAYEPGERPSCRCPALPGEDCPLTNEQCLERTTVKSGGGRDGS